ncbi:MAG TPA: D-alanine--D-alanine ligase family protein [Kofleriaceae bacterium]|nr:D-alanine--D-alanine ligase family protein [Kofleriaceae bacterium]
MTSRLRVGVLFGGRSAEHEVSILSARNVVDALDPDRYEPVLVGIDPAGRWSLQSRAVLGAAQDALLVRLNPAAPSVVLEPTPRGRELAAAGGGPGGLDLDVVFPVLHGPMGEDGTVQGLLELAGLPYVGAGVLGSAVGMDKDVMKRLLRDAGLPVGRFVALRKSDFLRDPGRACELAAGLGFPLFTKPANLGSSVGISRVPDRSGLEAALAHSFEFDTKALAEARIVGREIECSVLGGDDPIASLPGEIVVSHGDQFYSYDAKYLDEHGAELCIPAQLTPAQVAEVQRLAVASFQALECHGLARVDFFLREDGAFVVNEINTLPGFTAISMYPKLWEASGLGMRALVTRLIELALERHGQRLLLRSSRDQAR